MSEIIFPQADYVSEEIGRGPFMPPVDELESGNLEEIVERYARMKRAYETLRRMRSDESENP